MRIITLNANGIRAAARKGFFDWLGKQKADMVCIQETKAQRHQLEDPVFSPRGYHVYYHDAEKKGYSGVAIYTRHEPDRVQHGIGWDVMDSEGRWLRVDFGDLTVVSLYLPSGSSKEERQQVKYQTMDYLQPLLSEMAADGRHYVICGDWNIAHRKIDIKNWRGNQKNSGFLPEERAWMDELFGAVGMADAFRHVDQREEQYTWWSNRGRAWDNNTGWRIDYHVTTPALAQKAIRAEIYKDERFSDHSPLIMDYEFDVKGSTASRG
jgi:exodeoxyribonuclease-3